MKLNYIKIDINIIKTKSKSSKFSDLLHNNYEDDQETILDDIEQELVSNITDKF